MNIYEHLSPVEPSPIDDCNRAIAVSFSEGPNAGLTLLDTIHLVAQLGECHLLNAMRADFLRRLGRPMDALPRFRRALELVPSDRQRRFLRCRVAGLRSGDAP